MPGKKRPLVIRIPANFELWREACGTKENKVLFAKGQPERPALIAEQNANMVAQDEVHNLGDEVAQNIRETIEQPSGNGHREQAEPPVDPEDDPGPLAAPAAPRGSIIISACVTARGTLVVVQGQGPQFKPMLPGKTFADVFTALRKAGLVVASSVGYEADASAFLINPTFVKA